MVTTRNKMIAESLLTERLPIPTFSSDWDWGENEIHKMHSSSAVVVVETREEQTELATVTVQKTALRTVCPWQHSNSRIIDNGVPKVRKSPFLTISTSSASSSAASPIEIRRSTTSDTQLQKQNEELMKRVNEMAKKELVLTMKILQLESENKKMKDVIGKSRLEKENIHLRRQHLDQAVKLGEMKEEEGKQPGQKRSHYDYLSGESHTSSILHSGDSPRKKSKLEGSLRQQVGTKEPHEPTPAKNFLEILRLITELHDSRPEIGEKFQLDVLIQPLAHFEFSTRRETAIRSSRSQKAHPISSPSSSPGSLTSYQLARDSVKYLHFLRQEEEFGNKVVSKSDYDPVLAGIIPLLADHIRLYLSVLENLTSVCHNTLKLNLSNTQNLPLPEVFSTIFPSASNNRTINFMVQIERNAKQALIILRRLIHVRPTLFPFFAEKIGQTSDFFKHFVSSFPFFHSLIHRAESSKDSIPLWQTTDIEEHNPLDAEWAWLSSRYRLDFKSQDLAMVRLGRISSTCSNTSVLDLCVMLMNCCKFDYLQPELVGYSAWIITFLAKSFPADNQLKKHLKSKLMDNNSLFFYLNNTKACFNQVTVAPILELFKTVASWKDFPICALESGDFCFLSHLFGGIFFLSAEDKSPRNSRCDLCKKLPVYLQAIRTLFSLRICETDQISAHLTEPSNRACCEKLLKNFCDILYLITRKFCSIGSANLLGEVTLEVPSLFKEFINESLRWITTLVAKEKTGVENMIRNRFHYLVKTSYVLLEFIGFFEKHTADLITQLHLYVSSPMETPQQIRETFSSKRG